MTEASIPPQPTQSLADTAGVVPDPGPDGPDAPHDLTDLDDLVIEDLTDASWPVVAPRICICTFSGE
ncbi:hypothetical protein [Streptomyces sp. NPDC021212]|uniref:hypothetical protein n=1 Tax=Streptomyces sp. NPDC021212 TaxID=3365118 RepID=UPI0037B7D3F0